MKKEKKDIWFEFDGIRYEHKCCDRFLLNYTVHVNDFEQGYEFYINASTGDWGWNGCYSMSPSVHTKVNRFVSKVMQQFGNFEVDIYQLLDKFSVEVIKKVK